MTTDSFAKVSAFVSDMMVANETPCAIFASITLFLIVIKAIFLYILSFAARTINDNLCMHNSNIPGSCCFLFEISYSTFFRTPPIFFNDKQKVDDEIRFDFNCCTCCLQRVRTTGRTPTTSQPNRYNCQKSDFD